jgi:hypothetical protein
MRAVLVLGLLIATVPSARATTVSSQFGVGIVIGAVKTPLAPSTQRETRLRYTPGAAAITLRRAGFSSLELVARSKPYYVFKAVRASAEYSVKVSAFTGTIIAIATAE